MAIFGQGTALVYAVLLIVGGVIGYTKAGSMVSLISGTVSGILLLIVTGVTWQNPKTGFMINAVIALLLAISFFVRFQKTGKFMPSGMLLAVSIVVLIIMAISATRS